MASNYKETHKISIKGTLNWEDQLFEIEDGQPVNFSDVFEKFNGSEVSLGIQLTNELD